MHGYAHLTAKDCKLRPCRHTSPLADENCKILGHEHLLNPRYAEMWHLKGKKIASLCWLAWTGEIARYITGITLPVGGSVDYVNGQRFGTPFETDYFVVRAESAVKSQFPCPCNANGQITPVNSPNAIHVYLLVAA